MPRRFARTGGAYRPDVDQPVPRPFGTAEGDDCGEGFWRRLRVLKSGTVQSRQIRHRRFSTNPPCHGYSGQWRFHGPVCRVDHAEKHLQRQAGLDRVRRENSPPDCFLILLTAINRLSPRLPVGAASKFISGSNQPVGDCLAVADRSTDDQRATARERASLCSDQSRINAAL